MTPPPGMPDSPGMAARGIAGEEDIEDVVRLLRINYDRLAARHGIVTSARDD